MAPDSSRTTPTGTAPVPAWAVEAARFLDPATLALVLGQTRAWSRLTSNDPADPDRARRVMLGVLGGIFADYQLRPDGSIDPRGRKRGDLTPTGVQSRLRVAAKRLAAAAAAIEAVESVDRGILAVGTGITSAKLRADASTLGELAAIKRAETAGAFRERLYRALGEVAQRTTGAPHDAEVAAICTAFLGLDVSPDAVKMARSRCNKTTE